MPADPNQANPALLEAVNLAYNPLLKLSQRLACSTPSGRALLPPPCEKVLEWHKLAQLWLGNDPMRNWIPIHHPLYPASLLNLKDPPLLLFAQGDLSTLALRSIGMVGSRSASRQGLLTAREFAKAFVQSGWAVISGLAEGIDGASHRGALLGEGPTVAVLGGAIDMLYPKCHEPLASDIVRSGGLLLSEYPPGTAPQPAFFPRRNRLIAALSDGLLVVEAALRSGSLITARVASELGKPVMAIPGSIQSTHAKGCHAMIKKGALLVETAADVLDEAAAALSPERRPFTPQKAGAPANSPATAPCDALSADCKQVLSALDFERQPFDVLVQVLQKPADWVLSALTELELEGLALNEAGNTWMRTA